MSYYHVAIAKKRGKTRWAFAFNLSREQLEQEIITPFKEQQSFVCSRSVIHPSDIEYIRITETEEPSSQILARTKKKRILEKVMTLFEDTRDQREHYIDEWAVIHTGKDVTRELIKGFNLFTEMPGIFTKKDRVFIVHGREDKHALLLQKYLGKLKVNAVMFDDLRDKGKTIIEQLEYIKDHVYHAFVIVTPDDVGCLREEIQNTAKMVVGLKTVSNKTVAKIFESLHERARQNVVFELGLFIGALGRENVCCILQKDVKEKPSDIDGILYKSFSKSITEVFHEIAEELKRES
jgi:predicted nucleotide-binding protein